MSILHRLTDSTKKRLFLSSTLLIMIPLVSIIVIVNFEVSTNIERNFMERIAGESEQIDSMISTFLEGVSSSIECAGRFSGIVPGDKGINRYYDVGSPTDNGTVKRSPEEQVLHDHLDLIRRSNPNYRSAIYGSSTGAYVAADASAKIPANWDPRKRPYFEPAVAKPGTLVMTKAFKGLV